MSAILSGFFSKLPPVAGVARAGVVPAGSARTLTTTLPARPGHDSVRIHYETSGRGDHPVLLLPGALGSTRTDFGPQLDLFKDDPHLGLVAWDPRGYGLSRPPNRTFSDDVFHRDADDAAALMKSLGLTPFSLMGWSDGGITALILAAKHPELTRKLVVWGSNSFISDLDLKIAAAVRDIDKWSERMRQPMVDLYGEAYFRKNWNDWVDFYHSIHERKDGDLCKDLLKDIACPTLIVHGEKDAMLDPQHPIFLRDNIKGSKLINVTQGKHNLHLRYAQEFNRRAKYFLLNG